MSKKVDDITGFIRIRDGILDHVKKNWIDADMLLTYLIMLHQCEWTTGVWWGSSYRIREAVPSWSLSKCVRVMNRLTRGQYIDPKHVSGGRGNYEVLINNFEPTAGPSKGKRLRKTETIDWRKAVRVIEES